MGEIIKTSGLTYAYKTVSGEAPKIVLSGIDLSVEPGEFVAVLGCNGSGKSTLAKHFNAMLLPVGGRVWISDMDTADERLLLQIRSTVGMVFQNPDNQIVATVVEDDVAFAPENLGLPPEEIRERVDSALKIVGMYDYRSHAPHLLSGGQKQRVAIAGVLAMKPRCIVFDEPTAMLDPRGRASVVEVIRRLRDEYGVTVILITHHMEETIDADRIIVMAEGAIVMQGEPREVFRCVHKLRELGLDVPETVSLLDGLNEFGFDLPLDALSIDECARAIYKAVKTN
jgi:energy-coupling factor transport system ATP-binding protein